jgi:hypothetical protein
MRRYRLYQQCVGVGWLPRDGDRFCQLFRYSTTPVRYFT